MPIVNIHLMQGRDDDTKARLVANVTKAICDSVNVPPEKVRIILSEMTENNYATAGILRKDQK